MKIQITGRHVDVTDALKQFTEERVEGFDKYNQKIMKVHVLLEVQKNIHHRCEINISGKNLHLNAQADTNNMYESINKCVEKVDHQLRNHKLSYNNKHNRISTRQFEHEIIAEEEKQEEESVIA